MLVPARPAAVLVNPDEFASLLEPKAVHADAALMSEIQSGLEALKARKARLNTLEGLLDESRNSPA